MFSSYRLGLTVGVVVGVCLWFWMQDHSNMLRINICGYGLINIGHALIVFVLVETSRVLEENETYQLYTHALECQPLEKSPKFVLSKEDPQLYSNEDLSGF